MVENRWPVRVAVNVMRARLTVLGFNIAIVSFQISRLYHTSGGLTVPGMEHSVHVGADMALFMALALSLIALSMFIMSGALDEVGVCTHWSIVAGDLMMYLGLAHTVAGFFAPLAASIETVAGKLPDRASDVSVLYAASVIAGGAAWLLATYVGPIVSLVRSPFHRRTNLALGITYLVLLLVLSWVSSHAVRLEAGGVGDDHGLIFRVLREMVQPFRW